MIKKKDYYNMGEIETIKIIEVITRGYDGYLGFLVGQVIKYLARALYKGQFRSDLYKANDYMELIIKEIGAIDDDNENEKE